MNRMLAPLVLTTTVLATFAATSLGASASGHTAKPPQLCFHSERVANWAFDGERLVNVRLQTGDVYQLTLLAECQGLGTYRTLAFDTSFGDQICEGRDATIITRSGVGPLHCPIKSVRRLSPEEAKALPDAQRP